MVVAGLVLGCASTPPAGSPPVEGTSPPPGPDLGYRLRATTVQALPPAATFTWTPNLVITDDLIAIQAGAIPLIFPGPLVNPMVGLQLTDAGWSRIVAEARAAGLLDDRTDFTDGRLAPGAATARLQLVVDDVVHDLSGDPALVSFCGDRMCPADPGTPEAFATFWGLLGDLRSWLGDGVGREAAWTPAAYAVLVGAPPAPDPQLGRPPQPWPLPAAAASFGLPVTGDPGQRCGLVEGDAARALGPIVGNATQLSSWRDGGSGQVFGLVVRPMLPGDEDPCRPLVG